MADRLLSVCRVMGVATDKPSMEKLSESTHADLRQSLNLLQLWHANSNVLSFNDVKASASAATKDFTTNPFEATRKLLDAADGGAPLNRRMENYFIDSSLVPLLVHENYLTVSGPSLDQFVSAAESISDGDLVDSVMRHGQRWELMTAHAILSSIRPSYMTRGGMKFPSFPTWLGKYSQTSRRARLLSDLEVHTRGRVGGDCSALNLDYIPTFVRSLTAPLVQKGVDGIDELI